MGLNCSFMMNSERCPVRPQVKQHSSVASGGTPISGTVYSPILTVAWVINFDHGFFVLEVRDSDLLRFKPYAPWLVARYKSRVSEAIKQVFDTSGKVIRVKGSHPFSRKADDNARHAFFFSICWVVQCWRFVSFKETVR